MDASINDGENEEVNETEDIDAEGESGCKSPVKKNQLKQPKKDLLIKKNGYAMREKEQEQLERHIQLGKNQLGI